MATELDVLVDLFWNYVRLGQWELSGATASLIKNISTEHFHDLLSAVVLQPKNHRYFQLYYIYIYTVSSPISAPL